MAPITIVILCVSVFVSVKAQAYYPSSSVDVIKIGKIS